MVHVTWKPKVTGFQSSRFLPGKITCGFFVASSADKKSTFVQIKKAMTMFTIADQNNH